LLQYLQLQLGTPNNLLTLDYAKWGQLLPLCWVKMLWRLLQHFNIHLYMDFRNIPFPRERDQIIMKFSSQRTSVRKLLGASDNAGAHWKLYSCQTLPHQMGDTLKNSSLTQVARIQSQSINFPAKNHQTKIGAHGSTSGIALHRQETNTKSH
jgi:hypothetical protein